MSPVSIETLLASTHQPSRHTPKGELLNLRCEQKRDVYNITAPFEYDGRQLIAGRSEPREDQFGSWTRFYHFKEDGSGEHDSSLPTLPLQDPSVTRIADGRWVLSGIKVARSINRPNVSHYHTEFYTGERLENLNPLVAGPAGMKDIRLVQMDDEIGIFTRPQGEKGGRGKIGFTTVKHLGKISANTLYEAPLINEVIADKQGEWGGVNEAHYLGDGKIGVLAHLARFVVIGGFRSREYYASTFIFDSETRQVSNEQIVACRDCFPETPAKSQDLYKVVFPGGMKLNGKTATVFAGISDTSAAYKHLDRPF